MRSHRSGLLLPLLLVAVAAACSSTSTEPLGSSAGAFSTASWVDGNVRSFKAFPAVPGLVYVLGNDGNLWRENGSMSSRTWVDGNVSDYQPLDGTVAYVLATNGNLWREVGSMSSRTLVASGVSGFQVTTDGEEHVFYLDAQAQLWLIEGGLAPRLVASAVHGYQWAPVGQTWGASVYVLHTNGTLWRHDAEFTTTKEVQVDANVSWFRAVDGMDYYVEGTDSRLWSEHDTWQTRVLIDTNVGFFAPFDGQTSFIRDDSFNLWREEFGARNKDLVDANVNAYQPIAASSIYVLRMDGNLWLESLAPTTCSYTYAPEVCSLAGQNYDFVAAWGVPSVNGACSEMAAPGGTWTQMGSAGIPDDTSKGTPTCQALGLAANCCIYVWSSPTSELQDPSVLCTPAHTAMVAFDECGKACPAGATCGLPGGGGCPVCAGAR